MPCVRLLLPVSLLLALGTLNSPGQKFQPKTIQFKGDPEYSDQELMTAADLRKGVVLCYADMNDHSQRLLGSGVFASLSFKFDGQDLIFQLTPSTQLVPIHLENLPLESDKALNEHLHALLPLYHGQVPTEGGLLDQVRTALEQFLIAEGVHAPVIATPLVAAGQHTTSAISFSIASLPVRVSVTKMDGISEAFQTKVSDVTQRAAKTPFDVENSGTNLEHALENFYEDQGYAAVKVEVRRDGDPIVTAGAITIPFAVAVHEGHLYKIGALHIPADAPISQTDIAKALDPHLANMTQGTRVRSIFELISYRYRSKGYLDCKVAPHPVFDEASQTVNYDVDVDPGAMYHLAFVKFENVTDQLRIQLMHNWQMMPGDSFDESYVANFIMKVQQTDPVLRSSLSGVKASFDVNADTQTHDVNVVIRLAKQ